MRLSLRRSFVYIFLLSCFIFLAVHQRDIWDAPVDVVTHPSRRVSVSEDQTEMEDNKEQSNPLLTEITAVASDEESRPWFMTNGSRRPTPNSGLPLWPNEAPGEDRIINQLMFVPAKKSERRLKIIYLFNGFHSWGFKRRRNIFPNPLHVCPVDTCLLSTNKAMSAKADAILYKDHFVNPGHPKPPHQVWILYFLECPHHTQHVRYNDVINWTATYRRDSDIVAPYERWAYYNDKMTETPLSEMKNYASNKTMQVAWFVSNCEDFNGRLQYAYELQKHITVDIYGSCGPKKCPRSNAAKCFSLLDKYYKFYLAFENSNCKDYITEKFFVNGLGHNVLPIVMGARPEDYARSAPHHSYIHVDDFDSPKDLAAYLHKLDADDDLYNSYFRWKGTGEFVNTYFFCRLCAMLHSDFPYKSYRDVDEWWRGPGTCSQRSWKEIPKK